MSRRVRRRPAFVSSQNRHAGRPTDRPTSLGDGLMASVSRGAGSSHPGGTARRTPAAGDSNSPAVGRSVGQYSDNFHGCARPDQRGQIELSIFAGAPRYLSTFVGLSAAKSPPPTPTADAFCPPCREPPPPLPLPLCARSKRTIDVDATRAEFTVSALNVPSFVRSFRASS